MKRISKILSIVIAAALAVNIVSSCNPLDKLMDADGENTEYGEYKTGWTEEGDKLIWKYGIEGSYTQVLIFEFKNDVCVKATGEFIWPTAILAQACYEGLGAEDKANAKVSGKKVTIDLTDSYKDLKKSDLKAGIDASGGWM